MVYNKEKITPKDSLRKIENTKMINFAEVTQKEDKKSSELIDRYLYWVKDRQEDRISSKGTESWRKQTEGGKGLVNNVVETQLSRAGDSASSMGDVTRWKVKKG